MSEVIEQVETEEEVDTQQDDYESEYDKAWSDEEQEDEEIVEESVEEEQDSVEDEEEEDLEQPDVEDEAADESNDVEDDEDSKDNEQAEEFAETLKWKGNEIPVTREELISLAQKGFDATKKWQEVASIRPFQDVIKEGNLNVEQVQILSDIVNGKNPEALALLAEQAGIDILDAERGEYKPKVENKNYELNEVVDYINSKTELAGKMQTIVNELPKNVQDMFYDKPDVLKKFAIDVENGIAEKVLPSVYKELALNPDADFIKTYVDTGTKLLSKNTQQDVKEEQEAKKKEPVDNTAKKKVAVTKKAVKKKKVDITNDYDAAWDDDEAFNKAMERLGRHNRI